MEGEYGIQKKNMVIYMKENIKMIKNQVIIHYLIRYRSNRVQK